jgi:putative transposase
MALDQSALLELLDALKAADVGDRVRQAAQTIYQALAEHGFPYVFLDATYCKARVNHRVVSQAVVIATGVRADGWREVLGFAVGDSEDGAFWTAFLRSLKARGLAGVQLVISDAHAGLKQTIAAVLLGTAWQRCRVH